MSLLCNESWRMNTAIVDDTYRVNTLNRWFESLWPLHSISGGTSIKIFLEGEKGGARKNFRGK